MAKKKFIITDHKKMRSKLDLSQAQYWGRIGVTQSCGCRYESGRNIPSQVSIVADMTYSPAKKAVAVLAEMRGISVDELIASCLASKEEK